MTLTPETRVLFTDALRPPAGYRVDVAVGTTYSLNLTALLLAPLSFALFDQGNSDNVDTTDPIRLLEAVRRHADHTTVFCQAGGIHVPSNYRSILTFIEDCVLPAMPFNAGAIFHPKIWALRFSNPDGGRCHRLVILSRNLTFDRAWDTALTLDEDELGTIDAAPAADFLRQLPARAVRRLEPRRAAQISDLATSMSQLKLAVPSPFTAGRLLPIGVTDERVWPFEKGRRLLAISPFLTKQAIAAIGMAAPDRTIVARPESLDLVGSASLTGWNVNVLQRLAEIDSDHDAPAVPDGFQEVRQGLHAKTFIVDLDGGQSMTVTGSANLTGATWGTNVEFDAVLIGPTKTCGVAAALDGSPEVPGLRNILEEYAASEDGEVDPAIESSYVLEQFHQQLAAHDLALHVTSIDAERVSAKLTVTIPDDQPGTTRIWLSSLTADVHARPLTSPLSWKIDPIHVTPFIAVETTFGEGKAKVTRRCVLKATLTGDIEGRRQSALFKILQSKQDVLRYLVFLLGDPSYDALFAQLAGLDSERFTGGGTTSTTDAALFEPLVRAMGRDEDALARVASLVEDLRNLPDGDTLVPDGFDELWDVVWQVHQESRK